MDVNKMVLGKIDKAIVAFENGYELTREIVNYLPKTYVKKLYGVELESVWHFLPLEYKREFSDNLPCYVHYNLPSHRTHIDGPPPTKFQCVGCKKKMENVKNDFLTK